MDSCLVCSWTVAGTPKLFRSTGPTGADGVDVLDQEAESVAERNQERLLRERQTEDPGKRRAEVAISRKSVAAKKEDSCVLVEETFGYRESCNFLRTPTSVGDEEDLLGQVGRRDAPSSNFTTRSADPTCTEKGQRRTNLKTREKRKKPKTATSTTQPYHVPAKPLPRTLDRGRAGFKSTTSRGKGRRST